MKIQIIIEPTFSKQWPKLRIRLNDTDWFNDFCKPNEGKHFVLTMYPEEINLQDSNAISIKHYDKSRNDTIVDKEGNIEKDRAIILKSISFNDLKVPEVILYKQRFFPDWPDQPFYTTNNLYFGYNGEYFYNFKKDVNKMYYENLIRKELQVNINNKKIMTLPSGEEIESFEFTGKLVSGSEKENITLDELYNIVNKNENKIKFRNRI